MVGFFSDQDAYIIAPTKSCLDGQDMTFAEGCAFSPAPLALTSRSVGGVGKGRFLEIGIDLEEEMVQLLCFRPQPIPRSDRKRATLP